MAPLLIKDLVVSKLQFAEPRRSTKNNGCMFADIIYPGYASPLLIQTPVVTLPYGISNFENKRSVEIPIPKEPSEREDGVQIILDKFSELDEFLIDGATANAAAWNLKPTPKKTKETYRGQAKASLIKEKKKNRVVVGQKVSTNIDKDEENKIWVEDATDTNPADGKLGLDYVTWGTKARLVFELSYVYLMSETYGIRLRLKKVQVVERGVASTGGGDVTFAEDPEDAVPE